MKIWYITEDMTIAKTLILPAPHPLCDTMKVKSGTKQARLWQMQYISFQIEIDS